MNITRNERMAVKCVCVVVVGEREREVKEPEK